MNQCHVSAECDLYASIQGDADARKAAVEDRTSIEERDPENWEQGIAMATDRDTLVGSTIISLIMQEKFEMAGKLISAYVRNEHCPQVADTYITKKENDRGE